MCECGCTSNDKRYTIPGPGKSYYLVTLRGHCVECSGHSAVLIDLLEPGSHDHEYYNDADMIDGPLPLREWDDKKSCTIVTGMLREEFVSKLAGHLVGIDCDEMGDDGRIDEDGAEVILEEMYDQSQTFPCFVK